MVKLITLDPGHFHAGLVQKTMYDQVDSNVYVYAPAGDDLRLHLDRINAYNTRPENPTRWNEVVYTGDDYFEKMLAEKKGNTVVLAGNNRKKTDYIMGALDAGLNVLADKPMVINSTGFNRLKSAFEKAKEKDLLLYDIMTERFEITSVLQRELSQLPGIFGTLEEGSATAPSVVMESGHCRVLTRPAWFLDADQQGQGIVDVTTHLVDLVQWECFPEQAIDYTKDIKEYELQILLPGNYKNSTKKYPVVYLMDSQWDFPLVKSLYGEHYFDGFIPELIVVGVTWGGVNPNPDSLRARDYTPTKEARTPQSGGADAFLSFMKKELFPFVETNYRADPDNRTLMGCSLGGLFTLYTLFTQPEMFNGYAAASPAVGWDKEVLYKYEAAFAAKKINKPVRVYMTVGDVERSRPVFEKFAAKMKSRWLKSEGQAKDSLPPNVYAWQNLKAVTDVSRTGR
ncbi:putative esterase, partial [Ostertagia ostertagi]